MKKISLIILSLTVIIGLCVFVLAAQGPFYTKDPVSFRKGWNLVYGFADSQQLKDFSGEKNILAVYAFIPTTQEYARTWPNPEADKISLIDEEQLLNSAFWVYSGADMNTSYQLLTEVMPFNERKIYAHWNFIGITSDMVGKSLNDIKGTCEITKVLFWDPSALAGQGNWDDESDRLDATLPAESVGKGIVVKVTNDCSLGSTSNIPSVPQLPQ